jgi:hypothetical protein
MRGKTGKDLRMKEPYGEWLAPALFSVPGCPADTNTIVLWSKITSPNRGNQLPICKSSTNIIGVDCQM